MSLKPPALDPTRVSPRSTSGYPEPFRSRVLPREKRALGDALGLTKVGVNLTTLLPGTESSMRHFHTREDELVFVIEGEVMLRTNEGEQVLTAGMCAGFPAGSKNGHQLVNRGARPARYLEISNRDPEDSAEYPDVDLAYRKAADGSAIFTHKDGTPYRRSSMGRTDTASLVIAGQPDAIYRAFAEPDALMAWLPPGNMVGRILEYDFREGGRYRIELTHDEAAPAGAGKTTARTDITSGRFLSLQPGKRIVQSVEFESADASFAGEMVMTWTLESLGEETHVTVTAENVPPGISKADHDAGLRSSLENLARYLGRR